MAAADDLEAGYYRTRRRGRVWRPVRIWFGPPADPITGEELDRSPRWQILYCGRFIWDQTLVWPQAKAQRIDRAEYEYLLARMAWADANDPTDPFASRAGPIDLLTAPPPF